MDGETVGSTHTFKRLTEHKRQRQVWCAVAVAAVAVSLPAAISRSAAASRHFGQSGSRKCGYIISISGGGSAEGHVRNCSILFGTLLIFSFCWPGFSLVLRSAGK